MRLNQARICILRLGIMLFYYLILVVTLSVSWCQADVFSSIQHMQSLQRREERHLDELNATIHYFQQTLDILVKKHAQLSGAGAGAEAAPEHPVDAFTLVRRLARDWPVAANLIAEVHHLPKDLLDRMKDGEAEMESALRGLHRLQMVYKLDTEALADGFVGSAQAHTRMTAADCMEMANWLSTRHLFSLASTWAYTAYRRVLEGDLSAAPEKVASHLYLLANLTRCEPAKETNSAHRQYLNSVLRQLPQLTLDATTSPELYKLAKRNDCKWYRSSKAMEAVDMEPRNHKMFNEMCHGPQKVVQGSCYYVHYGQMFLKIAPFKMEEMHIKPPIILVHDVISDREIAELKNVFKKVMTNCETLRSARETLSTFRTCTLGWVTDDLTPVSSQLTRRIGQLANLDMSYSEVFQMASYGLGGEYKLHYDTLKGYERSIDPTGHRIATVMLYLNEVTAGGYTVFPLLKVAVAPVKGAALLWFNILPDGTLDDRTFHGGCPVLLGSKWILNKWIREGGDEWLKHCPIDRKFSREYFYL